MDLFALTQASNRLLISSLPTLYIDFPLLPFHNEYFLDFFPLLSHSHTHNNFSWSFYFFFFANIMWNTKFPYLAPHSNSFDFGNEHSDMNCRGREEKICEYRKRRKKNGKKIHFGNLYVWTLIRRFW